MPAPVYSVVASGSLVGGVAKTAVELSAGAANDFSLVQVKVSFDGVSAANTPVKVELITYTATGTGTGYTPNKISNPSGRGANTTAKVNLTVEGTGSVTVVDGEYVSPTAGEIVQFPLGREKMAGLNGFIGIRLNAPQGVNYIVSAWIEE